jgi:ABC-2 type transport system ATP-binding protein
LSEAAKQEIAEVIRRHGGQVESIDNPTTTMEELFLNIVRESERRPGARRVASEGGNATGAAAANAEVGR